MNNLREYLRELFAQILRSRRKPRFNSGRALRESHMGKLDRIIFETYHPIVGLWDWSQEPPRVKWYRKNLEWTCELDGLRLEPLERLAPTPLQDEKAGQQSTQLAPVVVTPRPQFCGLLGESKVHK